MQTHQLWLSAILLSLFCVTSSRKDKLIYIGGIFPINGSVGWQGGQACQPAAMLAMEDVNKHENLLPGYKLKLVWNDSLCEPGHGAAVMYDLIYNDPMKLMLLGGCSTVSTTIGEAARLWNLVVVSFGSSSPALSDRKRFPTFFRTHPSAIIHNPTRVKLMQKFKWSRIAIIQQTEEVFISTVEDLEKESKIAGIEIATRQSFLANPTEAVRNLKRQDARIIVGLFYVVAARRVLCEIYKNDLYGKSYVWFFIGWYEDGWYANNLEEEGVNCTQAQMKKAAEGHITTEAMMWNKDNRKTVSGMTSEEFRQRLDKELVRRNYDIANNKYPEGYQEAPLAYDAIWSMVIALNKTMNELPPDESLEDFNYSNVKMKNKFKEAMNATGFLGISGHVAFSVDGSRIALTQIEQMINGKYQKLGYYDFEKDNLTWFNNEVWLGGKVPQDRTIIRPVLRTISLTLVVSMSTICACGILWAIVLLLFTFLQRHRRYIQLSHPTCNNTCLVGVILCLGSVFLLGLDGRFVPHSYFNLICGARAWCLCLGFSLAYGAMFSKVWRVHRLATKANLESKQRVEPWKLYAMVSVLLVIDIIILGTWQGIDPLRRSLEEFPLEDSENSIEDVKIKPVLEHCESRYNNIWLGIIYSYKGFLLFLGLFLSYETRSIKLKQINDSRLVGMSIYNVVVLCLITAPVTLIISSQQDASFAFVALAIIFCCFLSMALIFVPKIIEVARNPRDRFESTDGVSNKEDEEKYQKILRENTDIQRRIAEKEEKIRLLKRKIQEKKAMTITKAQQKEENHVVAAATLNCEDGQTRSRHVSKPSVRIVTPNSAGEEKSFHEPNGSKIRYDISESYL